MNLEDKKQSGEMQPKFDPKGVLASDYEKFYIANKSDSPEQSRTSLVRRIRNCIVKDGIFPARVLNIGSGPQVLEKQLLGFDSRIKKGFQFISIDIAKINPNKLLARKLDNAHHVRGDAVSLPFPDKSFGLVVSNHAIDFCPQDEAFKEAFRVLNDGGKGIFYLHHPSMLEKTEGKDETVLVYWKYLRNENILFSTEDEIKAFLEGKGFVPLEISVKNDEIGGDKWWEVVAEKSLNKN